MRAPLPIALRGVAVLALVVLVAGGWTRLRRGAPLAMAPAVILAGGIVAVWTLSTALAGVAIGGLVIALRGASLVELRARAEELLRTWSSRALASARSAIDALVTSYEARRERGPVVALAAPAARIAWTGMKLGALVLLGVIVAVEVRELLALLANPL